MTTLRYRHNHRATPDDFTTIAEYLAACRECLDATGCVHCSLMPGDGTHYDLVIHMNSEGFLTIRADAWLVTVPGFVSPCFLPSIPSMWTRCLVADLGNRICGHDRPPYFYDWEAACPYYLLKEKEEEYVDEGRD